MERKWFVFRGNESPVVAIIVDDRAVSWNKKIKLCSTDFSLLLFFFCSVFVLTDINGRICFNASKTADVATMPNRTEKFPKKYRFDDIVLCVGCWHPIHSRTFCNHFRCTVMCAFVCLRESERCRASIRINRTGLVFSFIYLPIAAQRSLNWKNYWFFRCHYSKSKRLNPASPLYSTLLCTTFNKVHSAPPIGVRC